VVGPASSTDNAVARYDLATGKLIQNSTVLVSDGGSLTVPGSIQSTHATSMGLYSGVPGADLDVNFDGDINITAGNYVHVSYLKTDNIDEESAASGVTIDGVLLKDGGLNGVPIATTTGAQTLTSKTLTAPKFADLGYIADANGNEVLRFGQTGSAVNEVTITNKGTGLAPTIAVTGNDTNISLNLLGKGTGIVYANSVEVATISGTQTLTNKRITNRVTSTTSASSLTPDISAADQYCYTALAANLTINAPTGTPVDGDKLIFRIKDNATARTLTWNAIYRNMGTVIPTTTVISKTLYVGCIYNAADTKWDVIAVNQEA
jgi:hypothetical protein